MKKVITFFVTLAFLGLSISSVFAQTTYIINESGGNFTVSVSGGSSLGAPNATLQNKIDEIKAHAAGANCTIQFGNGSEVIEIGDAGLSIITFDGGETETDWGTITLTGKATSDCLTVFGIINLQNGVSINCRADITATANNTIAILSTSGDVMLNIFGGTVQVTGSNATAINMRHGMLTISNGTVQATGDRAKAISNYYGSGSMEITGGTVSATSGVAVSNYSFGTVNITGGIVSATTGIAVYNDSERKITISGNTTIVTSANEDVEEGTIYLRKYSTGTGARLEIIDGTVENTENEGNAIYNDSSGAVEISNGTVKATTGVGVLNNFTGVVNISGGTVTVIRDAIVNNSSGVVNISGGTVTATGDAIVNNSSGKINISGSAQVSTTTTGVQSAIYNPSSGEINVSGGTISGGTGYALYSATASTGAINISGGTMQTNTRVAIHINGAAPLTVSGGTVQATQAGGRAIYNVSTGAITISGGTVQTITGIAIENGYIGKITVSGSAYITSGNISNSYPGTIYLFSDGTSTDPRLEISGGTVENTATDGIAIYNISVGEVNISGGNITTTNGTTVINNGAGIVNISGGEITSTSDAIVNSASGVVNISGGTVSGTDGTTVNNFSTGAINITGGIVMATTGYALENSSTGLITVIDGAVFAYGSTIEDVINGAYNQSGNNVIVAWNKPSGDPPYEYESGASDDIFIFPEEASAVWVIKDENTGILVDYNINNSFIPIEDIIIIDESGIDDFRFTNNDIRIYPNPTKGEFNVQCSKFNVEDIEIFDVFGRLVLISPSFGGGQGEVDISHLPAGVYFVTLATEKGKLVQKIIKE